MCPLFESYAIWYDIYHTQVKRHFFKIPENRIKKRSIRMISKLTTIYGTPEGIRTPDLLVRSQTLYPTELPARITTKRIITHLLLICQAISQKTSLIHTNSKIAPDITFRIYHCKSFTESFLFETKNMLFVEKLSYTA